MEQSADIPTHSISRSIQLALGVIANPASLHERGPKTSETGGTGIFNQPHVFAAS